MSREDMRPARPSARTCLKGTGDSQTIQRAPPLLTVPSWGRPSPVLTSKSTLLFSRSTIGSTQAFLFFFLASQNDRTRGISAPQAGLGQATVRAQSQAITVASSAPLLSGRRT